MPVNATTFLTENIMPLQKVAQHFEASKARGHAAETTDKPARDRVSDNLDKLKTTLAENNITLKFSRDEATNALVVALVNNQTGESIRQMPSEVSLKLSAIFIKMQGQFIDAKE
jgi:uncharacterized FlaG/YvyC family protein